MADSRQNNVKQSFSFVRWTRKIGLGPKTSFFVAMLAIASGIATYESLTIENPAYTRILLIVDVAIVVILAIIITHRLIRTWRKGQVGGTGSMMHRRILRLFSLIAVAPALMVALFSALFFNIYFQRHFSDPVNMAVSESIAVADAYIKEHIQNIRSDVLAMATQINRAPTRVLENRSLFDSYLSDQVIARNLSEAVVLDGNQKIIAQSDLSFALEFDKISPNLFSEAREREIVVTTNDGDDQVRALIRLDRLLDGFLYVGRFIEPRVLAHMERTRAAAAEYEQLKEEGFGIQIQFAVIFFLISLMVVLAAVWFGLVIASRLVGPIESLVKAAERVRSGDLTAKVDESRAYDEMATLSRAFNRMTEQLSTQRQELEETNTKLDERRRFTEAVLSGVSSGVIGLDKEGVINLPNRKATELLGHSETDLIGKPFFEIQPQMAVLLDEIREKPYRVAERQIQLQSTNGHRHLLVRAAAEISVGSIQGFVVTLDDITDLVSAQRMAAWGDIARRIAHEIKNPLTPIQLSAERIKRKYGRQIENDVDIFNQCTDTIIRQVGDIGQMVDEFSAFARMPTPEFKLEDLGELVGQAIFLQKIARPEIDYLYDTPRLPMICDCDAPQVNRVLTNLLQNAADAIEGREAGDGDLPKGRIKVEFRVTADEMAIEITDNGRGLPKENRSRLTEPYVTHREKGTGLGLAIVNKIMEEHGGSLAMTDAKEGTGACVRISFPLSEANLKTGND
ncbi:PAS domain-containing sensor histidine kinase [Sneathiella sp.]|uniref:sensor histidine kinase NtrY-like n=1 Tax=Sneathiella sp. TaxID=1964365 RepID=UPI002619E725|nr:PAS domain-containing sensor histidine kinase [Sneathiella sp.]MDF2368734.1 PAS domain-containing sensor histidine kinase [Sneathiella sp.]